MNPFRQLMQSSGSHPPIGTWIISASPVVAEAIGHAGFDWVVIDMEHAPLDTMQVLQLLQALGSTRVVQIVRVPWNDAVMVKRVLDAGAQTVLFPFVQNAVEAAHAVAATRYPPRGRRGMSDMSRASKFGSVPNYLLKADAGMGVIVQLESPPALQQLETIAAVEGVDALFIDPADLSAGMGHVGQFTHPAVMQAMADAARRCRQLGKPIGTAAGTPEVLTQYRAMGYDFVAVASDLGLLMQGAQRALRALRMADGETHVHSLLAGTQTDAAR